MEYRRRRDGLFHAPLQIELENGKYFFKSEVLVDAGANKCMIPGELNERFLHLAVAGIDPKVDTTLGETPLEWVVMPKMTLMKEKEVHTAGPIFYTYALEKTDLSQGNVETWLGDCFVIGMSFISRFDVRMTKDCRIIFES